MIVWVQFREIPAWSKRMQPIHESCVVAHFRWQGAEKVCDALLLLHVNVEVADHHNAALSTNVVLAAAELARSHIAFHDVYAILLIKGDAGHFIETHHVVLTDQSALAGRIVDKHL